MNISRTLLAFMLIIGAGGAVATGTSAFFNDTETSTGNSFTAGAIDLKIDHTKQTYNDDECQSGCVEVPGNLLAIAGAGFEDPVVGNPDLWNIFDSPAGGWTVEWRSDIPANFGNQTRPTPAHLELHRGVLGAADEGNQYAELDTDWGGPGQPGDGEPASVTIYKDIPTVAGKKYMIRYAFAPRPNTPASDNRLEVKWGGTVVDDTGNLAGGGGPIAWQEESVEVTATTTTTRVQFTDMGTANSLGSFLDDLRVQEMNCETTITNGQCKLWDEKDLSDGDVFWNFSDVKPGDKGTNVISLHVYDNDAYACMTTDNISDNENTNIEPEQTAGDTDTPEGELLQFLKLFVWGDTDGDGVYDVGESGLYTGGFEDVAMSRFALQATTTAYLGAAWCFGDMTPLTPGNPFMCDGTGTQYNVAQTDSVVTDVIFTAVQQRNNSDFQCVAPEDPEEPEEPTANLFATKIVCPAETSLPNWGNNGPDITSTTATEFLAAHQECHIEPWSFQWTIDSADPDDSAGVLGGWTTFTTEDQVPLGSPIYVREVFQNGYIPFTGQNTDQSVSAELYCSTDVLHYDNWEWVPSPVENANYYCVAFNVPTIQEVVLPPPSGN